jgi:hypothetical protein
MTRDHQHNPAPNENAARIVEVERARQRPRWFRFSLRTMFVVVTVFAVPLGWLAWEWRIVRERRHMVISITEGGGSVWHPANPTEDKPLWYRRWVGDELVTEIEICDSGEIFSGDTVRALFPEAGIVFIPQSRSCFP